MTDETERPNAGERPPTPPWVKAIGLGILVVLVLAIVILIVSGGKHGPGMHGSWRPGEAPLAVAVHALEP